METSTPPVAAKPVSESNVSSSTARTRAARRRVCPGTVYAPNGTLALYGATVYIPRLDPGPLPAGPQCDRCDASGELPGGAIARAISDEAGHFSLTNVPGRRGRPADHPDRQVASQGAHPDGRPVHRQRAAGGRHVAAEEPQRR